MEIEELSIEGCYLITPRIINDERGCFVKTLNKDIFLEHGLCSDFEEEYFSLSNQNVLRGMHFQKPPSAHAKLIYCMEGEVLDVFVDIRRDSSTYQKHQKLNLDSTYRRILYLPPGIAHGFYTLTSSAIMIYKTSTCYDPVNDDGILWNSCGIDWMIESPLLSARDESFLPMNSYKSPF